MFMPTSTLQRKLPKCLEPSENTVSRHRSVIRCKRTTNGHKLTRIKSHCLNPMISIGFSRICVHSWFKADPEMPAGASCSLATRSNLRPNRSARSVDLQRRIEVLPIVLKAVQHFSCGKTASSLPKESAVLKLLKSNCRNGPAFRSVFHHLGHMGCNGFVDYDGEQLPQ